MLMMLSTWGETGSFCIKGDVVMEKTNYVYYYPFCSESYWPTASDAMQEMRNQAHYGGRIEVYQTLNDAQYVAESTVFEDETWIVVEIKVTNGTASVRVASIHGDFAEEEFDDNLLQYFDIQPLCE